jgi:hypothetical protein
MNDRPSIKDTTSPKSQPPLDPGSKNSTGRGPSSVAHMTPTTDIADGGGSAGRIAPSSVKGGHD